jgi:hypothetical protein
MRLPQKLIAAINTYFAFRRVVLPQVTNNTIVFKLVFEDENTNLRCSGLIEQACFKYGWTCYIAFGNIYLHKNGKDIMISGPIEPDYLKI